VSTEIVLESQFGERLKTARVQLRVSQSEFARKIEATPGHISKLEAGRVSFSSRLLSSIESAWGISKSWLETGEGPMFSGGQVAVGQGFRRIDVPVFRLADIARLGESEPVETIRVGLMGDRSGAAPVAFLLDDETAANLGAPMAAGDYLLFDTAVHKVRDDWYYIVEIDGEIRVVKAYPADGRVIVTIGQRMTIKDDLTVYGRAFHRVSSQPFDSVL
jgi:transcriptional regulator with XRE-family HTH domain